MKILITGGSGFIASHLKHYLSVKGHTVYAPNRTELDCFDFVAVTNFFKEHSIDVVVHTALTGRENLFEVNPKWSRESLTMWKNIYDCRHLFKKLIQFGTAYELDLTQHNEMTTLDDVIIAQPTPSYGFAKNIIAKMCNVTPNFYTLRIFGNVHYTEKDFRFFKKLSTASTFTINEDRKFDYFNLDDILTVVNFVIDESPSVRDINLVYEEKLLLTEQVEMFCAVNKISPEVVVNSTGYHLTGNPNNLKSFNLPLEGLVKGFEKFSQLR